MAIENKKYRAALWVILLVVALFSVLPFAWVVAGSFKPHLEIQAGRLAPWESYDVRPRQVEWGSLPQAQRDELLRQKRVRLPVEPGQPAPGRDEQLDPARVKGAVTVVDLEHVTANNYRKVLTQLSGLPTYYFNTVYLSLSGTFLSLLIGSLAAYGFAHFKFPGNKTLFTLLLLTIMIPGEVMLIGEYELMFKLALYDRIAGLLIAYTAGHLLLVIFIMRNVFGAIPQDLIDAAMIDGAGSWQVFWDLMVPMGRNGLAACAILGFLGIWNEFLFALTFTSSESIRTLPVGIVLLKGQHGLFESGVLFATVLLSFLPIVIVFVLLQKYFVRGLSAGALKA